MNDTDYTLITGASLGLGRAMAFECANRGMNLILVSLPGENLEKIGREIAGAHRIDVRSYETDLTQKEAPLRLAGWVRENFRVNILINNAGIGGSREFDKAPVEYLDAIIQLNVRATSLLTHALLPELKTHRSARILNVASLAACRPFPFKTIYPASKAFILSFSRGLNAELRGTSVKVSVLLPGPLLTNPDVIRRLAKQGAIGKISTLSTEAVARIAIRGMNKGKAIIVPGLAAKLNYRLLNLIPTPLLLLVLRRVFLREAH